MFLFEVFSQKVSLNNHLSSIYLGNVINDFLTFKGTVKRCLAYKSIFSSQLYLINIYIQMHLNFTTVQTLYLTLIQINSRLLF